MKDPNAQALGRKGGKASAENRKARGELKDHMARMTELARQKKLSTGGIANPSDKD